MPVSPPMQSGYPSDPDTGSTNGFAPDVELVPTAELGHAPHVARSTYRDIESAVD